MTAVSATAETAGAAAGARAKVVNILLGVLLVLAPLFRSGQPPLAEAVLQLLGVVILLAVLWGRAGSLKLNRGEVAALVALVALPLLYLLPLPAALVAGLPGRQAYLETVGIAGGEPVPAWSSLSLYPQETFAAFLFLLPPVAVYLAVRACDATQVVRLVMLVLALAALQVVLGLMQYGAGTGPTFLGMEPIRRAIGTYTNPNHLAGLVEMVLPVVLALYIFSLGRREADRQPGAWRRRLAFFATVRGHRAFWFGALAVLLLIGVIFTRSRAGIGLTILGILVTTLVFSRRIGGENVYGTPGTIVAIAIGIGAAIGLAPVFDRFSAADTVESARVSIWSNTLDGIGAFFPVGSGPGTYPDVFPAFQPLELGRWFINHAHNDYLEWLFDGGIPAAVVLVLLLALYFRRWAGLFGGEHWSRYRFLQIGSGIGMLLLLLHELVDYNLMMPANAVYFAFFAGIFMRDFSADEQSSKKRRRRRTVRMEIKDEVPDVRPSMAPPKTPVKNPFMD